MHSFVFYANKHMRLAKQSKVWTAPLKFQMNMKTKQLENQEASNEPIHLYPTRHTIRLLSVRLTRV